VYRLYDTLPDDEVLIAERLRQTGYQTALFGKLHVSGRLFEATTRHPNDGFDIYEWCLEPSLHMEAPFNGYSRWLREKDRDFHDRMEREKRKLLHHPRELHMTRWAAERTIDFIRNSENDKPFFCFMSVFDPHDPYEAYPLEMRDCVDASKIPDPLVIPGEMDGKPYGVRHEHEHSYLGAFDKYCLEDLRKMRLGYLAAVALIDLEIGRVLAALDEKGIAGNTVVIFTSDHSDMLGDHQLLVKGAFFYDQTVKVPLIVRWPGRFPGGKRLRSLVQLHDLAATLAAAAGCSPEDVTAAMPESRDLMPLCTGQAAKLHDFAVCCYRNSGIFDNREYADPAIHATMIRDDRYKLNLYHGPSSGPHVEGELYDMETDITEVNNLWRQPRYQKVRAGLTEQLLRWLADQELRLGSRGGEIFPAPSERVKIT